MTIMNTGNAALDISSVTTTMTNGTFNQLKTCGATLAAGASCSVSVTWTPKATGAMTGSIKMSDNALGSPQVATLSGTGVLPDDQLAPDSLTFPNQVVYTTSSAKTVTLTNPGSAELVISKIAVTGDFTQTTTCGKTVAPGGTCTFSIAFAPTAAGSLTGALTITSNNPTSPQKVTLAGTGTDIQFTPASLTFGNQPEGSSSPTMSVTMANQGASTVTLSGLAITGTDPKDFTQTNNCGKSLASGARCSIEVTFKPTATGKRTAAVSVSDNGGGSPQTVALSGTGTP
jgi:hypothetical protein